MPCHLAGLQQMCEARSAAEPGAPTAGELALDAKAHLANHILTARRREGVVLLEALDTLEVMLLSDAQMLDQLEDFVARRGGSDGSTVANTAAAAEPAAAAALPLRPPPSLSLPAVAQRKSEPPELVRAPPCAASLPVCVRFLEGAARWHAVALLRLAHNH
eukprot:117348-Chlamydomonas_euryale.AAC.1